MTRAKGSRNLQPGLNPDLTLHAQVQPGHLQSDQERDVKFGLSPKVPLVSRLCVQQLPDAEGAWPGCTIQDEPSSAQLSSGNPPRDLGVPTFARLSPSQFWHWHPAQRACNGGTQQPLLQGAQKINVDMEFHQAVPCPAAEGNPQTQLSSSEEKAPCCCTSCGFWDEKQHILP